MNMLCLAKRKHNDYMITTFKLSLFLVSCYSWKKKYCTLFCICTTYSNYLKHITLISAASILIVSKIIMMTIIHQRY